MAPAGVSQLSRYSAKCMEPRCDPGRVMRGCGMRSEVLTQVGGERVFDNDWRERRGLPRRVLGVGGEDGAVLAADEQPVAFQQPGVERARLHLGE